MKNPHQLIAERILADLDDRRGMTDGLDDDVRAEILEAHVDIVRNVLGVVEPVAGWISVDDRLPPDGEFVLVKCPSGYTTTPFVYTTARRQEAYRPGRWIDHANDDLRDWGMEPTHWRALP